MDEKYEKLEAYMAKGDIQSLMELPEDELRQLAYAISAINYYVGLMLDKQRLEKIDGLQNMMGGFMNNFFNKDK